MQGAPLEFSTFIADSLGISPSETSAYLGVVLGFGLIMIIFGLDLII